MVTGRQYVDYMGNKDYYYFAKSTDEFPEYVKGAMVKNKTIDGYIYNGNGICTNNDTIAPDITVNNITYGENLVIRFQDNLSGVSAWQISQSSSEPISGWTEINKIADITVTKEGLSAGKYYIWVKDYEKNVTSKQITVMKKQIEVEWNNKDTFIYNGNNQGPTLVNTQINGVNNEIINLSIEGYQSEIGENYTATAIILYVIGGQENKNNYELTGKTKIFSIGNSMQIGDLNNNGIIDIGDTLILYRHIALSNNVSLKSIHPDWELSDEDIQIGDINKNGTIDIGDVLKLQRYISAGNTTSVAEKHPDWLVLD